MTASVVLENAGKRFTKYDDNPMLIARAMQFRSRSKRTQLWAVRGLDLAVDPGHCVGIIGANGSGKSTTMQMLAGVTAPTEGRVRIRGRVAPLISVGVGFHPELTGRENVMVNGMILGMSRRQIEQRLESIVDFAEIPAFVDTPVKFYSSGMFVRLGFSVAIHAEPEVLLVDEVLAVGDFKFQLKCFDRMKEIRDSGTTILVVSHNLNAVRNMCDRTTLLHQAEQRFDGPTEQAISLYHQLLDEQRELDDELDEAAGRAARRGVVTLLGGRLLGADGEPTANVDSGDHVQFEVDVRFERDISDPILGISIVNKRNINVYSEGTRARPLGPFRAGETVTFQISVRLSLAEGSHTARIGLLDPDLTPLGERALDFYVTPRRRFDGVADLGAEFHTVRTPASDSGGLHRT